MSPPDSINDESSRRSPLDLAERPIDRLEIETRWIEPAAGPFSKTLVLLMGGIRDGEAELRVAKRASDIFGRARIFAGNAVD